MIFENFEFVNPYSFQSLKVLDEESISVVPGEENLFDDVSYTLFLKSQVLCTDYRWVDQVKAQGIGTKLVNNLDNDISKH